VSITTSQQNPVCPECACKLTVKKGVRRNRLQTLQVFRCTECLHRFTGAAGKNKTYPLRLILETVSTFNLGYSATETQQILRRRFHQNVPERTISSWLNEHRPLTTYARLRTEGKKKLCTRNHPAQHNLLSPAGVPSPSPPGKASDSSWDADPLRFRTPGDVSLGTGTQLSSSAFRVNRTPFFQVPSRTSASHCPEGESCDAHSSTCATHITEQQETPRNAATVHAGQ
jgi:transposase-like protein